MINPLRSEEEAFRFLVIVAALAAPVALAAVTIGTTAALVVAAALAVGVVAWVLARRRAG